MDDVVGASPEKHFMSDFEHVKTSLHLTDVVVLRHDGDTVNFLGLDWDHQDTQGIRGEKEYRLRRLHFEPVRVGQLETDTESW